MKLTKAQASEKYTGVFFIADGVYDIESKANIRTGAIIESNAIIRSGAIIGSNATIRSGAVIESNAIIRSGAIIGSNATIRSGAVIEPRANIGTRAVIGSRATIESNAVIGSGRKEVKNALVINGLGETKRMTAHDSEEGLIIVIGCLNDYKGASLDEAKITIAKKYPASHPYFAALKLAQAWYESLRICD